MRYFWVMECTIVLLVIGLVPVHSNAAYIKGEFSGFDIRNFTGTAANDFELELSGFSCDDIENLIGYKTSSPEETWDAECEDLGVDWVKIVWSGAEIEDEGWMHFGFELKPGNYDIDALTATWTYDGEMTGEMEYLYQDWTGFADCEVGDYIEIPGESPPFIIERRWAPADVVYPLQDLRLDNPSIQNLGWSEPEYLLGNPGDVLELMIQTYPGNKAILVYYSARAFGSSVVTQYYLNQVKIRRLPFPTKEAVKEAKPVESTGIGKAH